MTYTLLAISFPGNDVVVLVLGTLLGLGAGFGMMRVVYRSQLGELVQLANRVLGRTTDERVAIEGAEECRETAYAIAASTTGRMRLSQDALR